MSEFIYPKHSTITFPNHRENDIEVTIKKEILKYKPVPKFDWRYC
jgi:hypothetical protein